MTVYLQHLSETTGGVALITSARAGKSSFEHERWGGGHGVFTHYLLEGMRGAADGAGGGKVDGVVTVRELFEYVHENVKRATGNLQEPWLGPNVFDERSER